MFTQMSDLGLRFRLLGPSEGDGEHRALFCDEVALFALMSIHNFLPSLTTTLTWYFVVVRLPFCPVSLHIN